MGTPRVGKSHGPHLLNARSRPIAVIQKSMSWTRIMDVGDWLRSLGLGQYETLFRQNDVEAEVLSELTAGDLEKFGVSFWHRKRLLKAFASLGSTETAVKPASPRIPSNIQGRWRAPAAYREILRSRRLDRDVGAARPRGYAARKGCEERPGVRPAKILE